MPTAKATQSKAISNRLPSQPMYNHADLQVARDFYSRAPRHRTTYNLAYHIGRYRIGLQGKGRQTRTGSIAEAIVNVLVGYLVAVAANLTVLPTFGHQVTVADGFAIGLVFTAISMARSYILRRVFNAIKWGNR